MEARFAVVLDAEKLTWKLTWKLSITIYELTY